METNKEKMESDKVELNPKTTLEETNKKPELTDQPKSDPDGSNLVTTVKTLDSMQEIKIDATTELNSDQQLMDSGEHAQDSMKGIDKNDHVVASSVNAPNNLGAIKEASSNSGLSGEE